MFGVIVFLLFVFLGCSISQDIEFRPHLVVGNKQMDPPGSSEFQFKNSRKRSGPQPLTPDELKKVYGISSQYNAGFGKTIAIVGAYGASTLEEDLKVFSAEYNLPECTKQNGCLTKVNQNGGHNLPPDDSELHWGMEAATDVQAVHAVAPGAKIIYVAANSPKSNDLFSAVKYAALHADYVSMSWGSEEGAYSPFFDRSYFEPFSSSVIFFASSGDEGSGGGISYPASSFFTVAVGGTTLDIEMDKENKITVKETGWTGSGGGCSNFVSANEKQKGIEGYKCGTKKSLPDVAALADPATGLLGYYSPNCENPPSCFYSFGGTSLAAPIWAAMAAVKEVNSNYIDFIYSPYINFRDITSGNNGDYSCKIGLDCVTGRGSWKQS